VKFYHGLTFTLPPAYCYMYTCLPSTPYFCLAPYSAVLFSRSHNATAAPPRHAARDAVLAPPLLVDITTLSHGYWFKLLRRNRLRAALRHSYNIAPARDSAPALAAVPRCIASIWFTCGSFTCCRFANAFPAFHSRLAKHGSAASRFIASPAHC